MHCISPINNYIRNPRILYRSVATAIRIKSAAEYVRKVSPDDTHFLLGNSEVVGVDDLEVRLRLVTERCPLYRQ